MYQSKSKSTKQKLYVFDLDETLIDNKKGKLYADVPEILNHLRSNGHLIYLASFNSKAPDVLKKQKIDYLFHGGAFGFGNTKYGMIKEIKKILERKLTPSYLDTIDIEFFDDLYSNIEEVHIKSNGKIRAVHIKDGLKWNHIKN